MKRTKWGCLLIWGFSCWLLGSTAPVAVCGPRVRVTEQERVVLRVKPMNAEVLGDPIRDLVLPPDRPGAIEMTLGWPGSEYPTSVRLRATPRPPRTEREHRIRLEADVELADGRERHSVRDLVFDESTTALFEIHREGERALTLAIEVQLSRDKVLLTRPTAGVPILLLLEIQAVNGERSAPLETNRLSTFVGESVSYSFQLGDGPEAESVSVKLTPLALYGDVADIEMEVSGKLPEGDSVRLVSRTGRWLTNRGATSSLAIEAGVPPVGYRFLVTPRF